MIQGPMMIRILYPLFRCLVLISSLWSMGSICAAAPAQMPVATNGVLAAPHWQYAKKTPLALRGQWQVIWGKILTPDEFDRQYQGDLVQMPRRWNTKNTPNFRHSYGTATYRLFLNMAPSQRDLAFHFISPNASWKLYQDGEVLGSNGIVSADPQQHHPNYTSRILPAKAGKSVLVLQLANFSHAYGGPGHPIKLWDRANLQQKLDGMSFYYVLVLGILFAIAVFHLIFYLADRRDRQNGPVHLWFGLLCLILVVRISGIIPYFHIYYPKSAYWSDLSLAYLSLFAAPGVYLLFFRAGFAKYFPEKTTKALIALCFAMTLFVLITPERIYTFSRDFAIALNVSVILYALCFTFVAMRGKAPGALVILIANFIFFLSALNDAIIYTDHAHGFDLTPFGILVLGIGYSYALLLRLQGSFLHAKQTSGALATLNLELEEQVGERTRAFQAAAAKAENNAHKGAQFIAAASHDLRQPLHALAMFNSALTRQVQKTPLADLVEKQGNSIRSMGILLQDTLDTARAETNNKIPLWADVRIADLMDQISNDFGIQAQQRNIRIHFSCEPGRINTDAAMLQRILCNLIDNALKAAHFEVSVRAVKHKMRWEFQIQDDGNGIADKDITRIFEPYICAHPQNIHAGYGLGLYVVHEFTQLLGGQIQIANTSKKGSTFQVTIPHRTVAPIFSDPQSQKEQIFPAPNLRVLAIDDEPDVLDAMQMVLRGWGCDVRTCTDLKQAQQHMRTGFAPQILLVDYHVYKTDGISIIHTLRAEFGQNIPAIIITGATEPNILQTIKDAKLDVLSKPVDLEQLARHLHQHQGRKN